MADIYRSDPKKYMAEYWKAHREELGARNKQYRIDNHEKLVVQRKRKYLSDPAYRARIASARRLSYSGWTQERFDEYLDAQEGCCAICGDLLDGYKEPHADHEHLTKSPRGLLCHHCNVGLGHFFDDPEKLMLAHEYLMSWSK